MDMNLIANLVGIGGKALAPAIGQIVASWKGEETAEQVESGLRLLLGLGVSSIQLVEALSKGEISKEDVVGAHMRAKAAVVAGEGTYDAAVAENPVPPADDPPADDPAPRRSSRRQPA